MEKRPNILFLMTDQHRFDALGCNGNTVIKTPHIDSIAKGGMNFSTCYTPIALCSPARGTLMTGLYPHRHGQLANTANFNGVFDRNILGRPALPRLLRESGYATGYAGKWHLPKEGDRETWGFDTWYTGEWRRGLLALGIDYDYGKSDVQRLEWTGKAPFCGASTLTAEQMQEYWVAGRTIDMLEQFAAADKPFMIQAAFFGPHFPIAPPAPYDKMYAPESVPQWGNFHDTFADKPSVQQKEMLRWNASHLTWKDWQKVIAHYWGFCSFIDDQIGRILDRLEELGLKDNTIIVYSCDHGDMLGSHRIFNKGMQMYEETHHIPFIVRWPGVTAPGSTCDKFISLIDFMPTMLDIAGAKQPDKLDGTPITPLLKGENPIDWRDDILCEFHGYEAALCTIRMVRTNKWKYIYNPCSEDELYDMESDPHELYNLAGRLAFKHVLRRMKERLLAWLRATDDSIVDITTWQSNSYDLFISDREL